MGIQVGNDGCRVMLTGGGTAGHVYPALAVLKELNNRLPSLRSIWIGSERSEATLVPQAGVDFHRIDIRFSYRWPTPGNWRYYRDHLIPLLFGKPFRQAVTAVEAFRPELIVATGGYVSAPVLHAAVQRGIPVALLSLDSVPGIVNWHYSERAWRILVPHAGAAQQYLPRCGGNKVRIVGYPARRPNATEQQVRQRHVLDKQHRVLLAMSGSLGAGAVHAAVSDLLHATLTHPDQRLKQLAVIHVAGERRELLSQYIDGEAVSRGPVAYRPVGYLPNAVDELCIADWYLGRCGASSLGELVACGTPSLLIPDPQHRDRQQYRNAHHLVNRGQGTILEQADITGQAVLDWLLANWDTPRLPQPDPPPAEAAADELAKLWEDA